MTLAIAIAANALFAVALLGSLAYVMSAPRRLAPHLTAVARVPRARRRPGRALHPRTPVAVG